MNVTRRPRSCRRRRKKTDSTPAARWTPPWRWALAQHRTSFSQPGHIRQRAVVPRWPEEPLAQLSWASSPWHRRRSRTDICDQARGRPSLRRNSRPSRGSAALAFPTSGVSTERVRGQHAWSQMHGRLRRRCRAEEDRCPVFASRAASADRYDSTCYRGTRCETGHSCCRAAHWRTRAVVWCDCTAAESGRAFVRRLGSTQPAPLLADMRRVECLSVCRARGGPVWAPRAGTRGPARSARGVTCDT